MPEYFIDDYSNDGYGEIPAAPLTYFGERDIIDPPVHSRPAYLIDMIAGSLVVAVGLLGFSVAWKLRAVNEIPQWGVAIAMLVGVIFLLEGFRIYRRGVDTKHLQSLGDE